MTKRKSSKIINQNGHECPYCHKTLKTETNLIRHYDKCSRYLRHQLKDEEFVNMGYRLWKLAANRKNKTKEDFLDHREFMIFIDFTSQAISNDWLFIHEYGKWCMDNHIVYRTWYKDDNYKTFIRGYILNENPRDAIVRSLEFIMENGYYGGFMKNIGIGKALLYVEMGKISPWLFLLYENRNDFFNRIRDDQAQYAMTILNMDVFVNKAKRYPKITQRLKETLQGIEI